MKTSVKTLLAAAISGYLAIMSGVSANNDVRHKLIEIRADENKNVVINVDDHTLTLSPEEMEDEELLALRLSEFDEKTRDTILQTIEGTKHLFSGEGHFDLSKIKGAKEHKMIVVNGGDGEVIKEMFSDDINIEVIADGDMDGQQKVIKKHVIVGHGDAHSALTGHTDAIVKLIERGEFSQDELDKIQMALDAKR